MASVYALTLSVEAFVKREARRPEKFKNKNQLLLAEKFLEKLHDETKDFCKAQTTKELKELFEKEIEILTMYKYSSEEEQLSLFPTPDTNKSVMRMQRRILNSISMYETFVRVCEYKELVAPRFSIVDKHISRNGKTWIKVCTVDSLGIREETCWTCAPNINSLEYRLGYDLAKQWLQLTYPNWQDPSKYFPEHP